MSEQHSNDSSQQTAEEASSSPVSNTVSRLEEEGEIGADYLEELLDIADLGGDIDIDIDDDASRLRPANVIGVGAGDGAVVGGGVGSGVGSGVGASVGGGVGF